MSIVKQIGPIVATIEQDSAGRLTISIDAGVIRPVEDACFDAAIRDLVGAVHQALIIWGLL